MPRHVREEYRVARAAAVGAAGAVVAGAALGLVSGSLGGGGGGNETGPPSQAALDEALTERVNQAPSRGLARAETAPTTGVSLSLAQAPEASPPPEAAAAGGVSSAPLPDVPESCEEYTGNQQIACSLLPEFGFEIDQMAGLVPLWDHESGWNELAYNESSGACGIPQALPCSKMATFGDDYETNPATQIRWGLDYIKNRYGTPIGAWEFWQANGWY